ncbi:dynamin family protein [Prevotella koreensis]|uniref:dynamin family protein n=1 Tax=Prevotella koreensis TaxID=2490854 RepID=UPI0028EE5A5E|nr:dynamin family protein [Prevotella koreensis]
MALVKKTYSTTTEYSPKKHIIKLNPYENPDNVMELMAKICSATPTVGINIFLNKIEDALNCRIRITSYKEKSLREFIKENRGDLSNLDFEHDLKKYCDELSWHLSTRENTEHTQIVVAGGFSSGKSSFLNRLTNSANLLPTGVEPVSIVKTYLYCSKSNDAVSVKGVNQKNVLVTLPPGVLQAIQHAKKSNIYLASVLEKLFVEIPSTDLDGLVFIDTPGYNNSDKENQANGKTDKQTAIEALGEGNVLFWLIDCERGTAVSDDIEIIKQFNGKKVIIFNKADKKGVQECTKIVDDATNTLYNEFSEDEIIDIIAFSTLDNKIYYSKKNKDLRSIIAEIKEEGNGISEINSKKELIKKIFDKEIFESENIIKNIEEEYKKEVARKNMWQQKCREEKERQEKIINNLKTVLIDNYGEVFDRYIDVKKESELAIKSFFKFYDGVIDFENNDHWGSSKILNRAIEKAQEPYYTLKKAKKQVSRLEICYDELEIKELIREINEEMIEKRRNNCRKYENICYDSTDGLERKEKEEAKKNDISKYKELFINYLEYGIDQYRQKYKATNIQKEEYSVPNVFECIKKEDSKQFMNSFENGVDLCVCNAEGYNPLTLAVQTGNNTMVSFLLNNGADPAMNDQRGYNAFHTAVENQYRDICKILTDHDPELIESKTATGESVEDLAGKHTFTKWIEQEINTYNKF